LNGRCLRLLANILEEIELILLNQEWMNEKWNK
jgi:hypothetical protein